jgi:hypothetical protein
MGSGPALPPAWYPERVPRSAHQLEGEVRWRSRSVRDGGCCGGHHLPTPAHEIGLENVQICRAGTGPAPTRDGCAELSTECRKDRQLGKLVVVGDTDESRQEPVLLLRRAVPASGYDLGEGREAAKGGL